jgi:hypothetical protein
VIRALLGDKGPKTTGVSNGSLRRRFSKLRHLAQATTLLLLALASAHSVLVSPGRLFRFLARFFFMYLMLTNDACKKHMNPWKHMKGGKVIYPPTSFIMSIFLQFYK